MKIIKVTIGSGFSNRSSYTIPDTTTLRAALETAEVDYALGGIHLDGCALAPGDIDRTFESFGIAEKCLLAQVANTKNA